MILGQLIAHYADFKAGALKDRFFKPADVLRLMEELPPAFETLLLGNSVEGRGIYNIRWGTGKVKVLLWSQMHGDEATGTMALFDLLNFLQSEHELVGLLHSTCELHFIPMVNPDGAVRFSRRNALQIDLNRDYLQAITPEAKLLKQRQQDLKPDFGFNLHDQNTLWSVSGSLKPATLSLLAPAFNRELDINPTRENAMRVIADMFKAVDPFLPGHIGLFDDEFEPRAFGDNFQQQGTCTILIEAGGFGQDFEKQEIRKYYFAALLAGLHSIASGMYRQQHTSQYFLIPKNNKQIFHILIHDLCFNGISLSVGLNYEEVPDEHRNNPSGYPMSSRRIYRVEDIGDLRFCDAYQVFSAANWRLAGDICVNQNANFTLFEKNEVRLCFEDGKLA